MPTKLPANPMPRYSTNSKSTRIPLRCSTTVTWTADFLKAPYSSVYPFLVFAAIFDLTSYVCEKPDECDAHSAPLIAKTMLKCICQGLSLIVRVTQVTTYC